MTGPSPTPAPEHPAIEYGRMTATVDDCRADYDSDAGAAHRAAFDAGLHRWYRD